MTPCKETPRTNTGTITVIVPVRATATADGHRLDTGNGRAGTAVVMEVVTAVVMEVEVDTAAVMEVVMAVVMEAKQGDMNRGREKVL